MHLYLPTQTSGASQTGVAGRGQSSLVRQTKIGRTETQVIHIDTANLKKLLQYGCTIL